MSNVKRVYVEKKSGFDVKSNVLVLEKMYYTDLS